ncbi:hypothetical protein ECDEC12D_3090 [Escherichia coli DEC12D]|nr:hypothetical protein ECDEC12D_3090 [Escherichia coli DEC12D]
MKNISKFLKKRHKSIDFYRVAIKNTIENKRRMKVVNAYI